MLTREQYTTLKLDCPDRCRNVKCDAQDSKTGQCCYRNCPAVQKAENKNVTRCWN